MFRKARSLSTCVKCAVTPAPAHNPFFAIGSLLIDGPAVKSVAQARNQSVAQHEDSARGGANGLAKLTQREKEVMSLLAHGLLYKEIADKLGISYSAVHKHQHKIFIKLGVTNRSEAARKWFEARGDH
jgi:DNA-binding NarL/FixJ family response regulator